MESLLGIGTTEAWFILAVVLAVAEAVISGAVLIFIAIGAVAAGIVSLASDNQTIQIGAFGLVSIISALFYRKLFKRDISKPALSSDGIELNKPELAYVGRVTVVATAIEGGVGRIKVGDGTWACRGPEKEVGERVKIIAYENGEMIVESLESEKQS